MGKAKIDIEVLTDPFPPKVDFVHYDCLKLYCLRCKMTQMLALWQFWNFRVTAMLIMISYNRFKSFCANTKIYQIIINRHADCLKITYLQILLDFSLTVKAAHHECVIKTSQP